MRRAWVLFSTLVLAVLFAGPTHATSVTVLLSAEWFQVDDSAGVLDASISVGGAFTATLVYDDSVTDLDPTGDGFYVTGAASSDLTIVSGNFIFSPGSDVGIGVENDGVLGDRTLVSATNYVASGLVAGGSGLPAYADFTFTDPSTNAHTSDALVGLNWVLGDFDDAFLDLFVAITGFDNPEFIELQGTVKQIHVLPEPS